MGLKDTIINLLLDTLRVPTSTLKDLVDAGDTDQDGYISLRELYVIYRKWKDGKTE